LKPWEVQFIWNFNGFYRDLAYQSGRIASRTRVWHELGTEHRCGQITRYWALLWLAVLVVHHVPGYTPTWYIPSPFEKKFSPVAKNFNCLPFPRKR
jgi:hypothetical protein